MKKVFLLAAGLAMILTACQKEESLSDPGGVCTQAITVTIPQELQTRAMAADFGNGSAYAKRGRSIWPNLSNNGPVPVIVNKA